jgi:hypothetical protein
VFKVPQAVGDFLIEEILLIGDDSDASVVEKFQESDDCFGYAHGGEASPHQVGEVWQYASKDHT